jgi:hypothetical protein
MGYEALQEGQFVPWERFLEFMRGPGVAAVVAVLLSFVVEYFPRFDDLAQRHKRLVFAGLCLVVPLVAVVLTCASGFGEWQDFEGLWWPAMWAGGAAFGVGQLAHTRKLKGRDAFVLDEMPKREGPHW